MAAPQGNQFAVKSKRWAQAIDRALAKRNKGNGIEALDNLAEELLKLAEAGDISALKELGDRIEGRPHQSISGPDDGPVQLEHVFKWKGE